MVIGTDGVGDVRMLALILLADAAAASAPASPPHVYLHPPPADCRSRDPNEITVCGGKDAPEPDRLRPVDDPRFENRPVRAAMKIGNGEAAVHGDRAAVGGFPSNRIMATLTLPF
jgi:hypothetical protein